MQTVSAILYQGLAIGLGGNHQIHVISITLWYIKQAWLWKVWLGQGMLVQEQDNQTATTLGMSLVNPAQWAKH